MEKVLSTSLLCLTLCFLACSPRERLSNDSISEIDLITPADKIFTLHELTENDVAIDEYGTIVAFTSNHTNIIIPAQISGKTVLAIGNNVFRDIGLTSVTIPDTVLSIGNNAFAGNQLSRIIIPDNVHSIGPEAFRNNLLETVTIPDNINIVQIGPRAFANNRLTSITIGNRANIGGYAFFYNQITSVTIGANVFFQPFPAIGLGFEEFYNHNRRRAGIYVLNNGQWSFERTNESDFLINSDGTIMAYTGDDTDIVIPAQIGGVAVTTIGDLVFVNMNVTTVIIPDGVLSIGYRAFAGNQLTGVIIPDGVISIGVNAFAHNQLTNVVIPNSVTAIGWSGFRDNQLVSVTIPENIPHISHEVFSDNQLTSITIPNNVISIFGGAFSGNQLTSITIGNDVELVDYFEHIGLMPIFDDNFDTFYNTNERKAGTYVFYNGQWNMR